ncbi:MAG TPA: hypothetical protein VMH81_29120 [Bryobacteraceae bacterium]|nr:hypothetical protein [Bryobacteraceae bacterium]
MGQAMGRSLFVLGITGFTAFALAAQALPQVLGVFGPALGLPFLATTEITRYAEDGVTVEDRLDFVSYTAHGSEIVVSSYVPGHPFVTAIRRMIEATEFLLMPVSDLFVHRDTASADRFVQGGCQSPGMPVAGHDVILNYPVVALANRGGPDGPDETMTMWYAPALGCLAMRFTIEQRRSDGAVVIRGTRRTVAVKTGI